MDRTKQKAKKEKPNKYVDKDNSHSFIADVKTMKENLKIREILRTVKMNSSMRIKAPRGSKVMQNNDFYEGEEFFDDNINTEGHDLSRTPSATNLYIVNNNSAALSDDSGPSDQTKLDSDESQIEKINKIEEKHEINILHKSKSISEGLEDTEGREAIKKTSDPVSPNIFPTLQSPLMRVRERKFSLDHTMLSKSKLSQSEMDLHSIGKLPLERKSSFFRKKMDSFLKNTTEIFKRQTSKSSVQRRGSTCSGMSVSMQSLKEDSNGGDYDNVQLGEYNEEVGGSVTSLRSSTAPARSTSSLSAAQSDKLPSGHSESSLVGNRPALDSSQPDLGNMSPSIHSLNEGYTQESFLHSRAISMSSGLDTAHGPRKLKSSRANRVTWVASESLTDYFRRLIQDEKTKGIQGCNSYQDFSTIPENSLYGSPKNDSKGRRLSYQRAVSGEDPVLPTRYQDTSMRRRRITDTSEENYDLTRYLAEFTRAGLPPLVGFKLYPNSEEALVSWLWAEHADNLEEHYDWKTLGSDEESKQAAIKEFINTEADHLRHLTNIAEVYLAVAHALQRKSKLKDLNTQKLFLNIPDVLNASLKFWELAIHPMISDALANQSCFNTDLMANGFAQFADIFEPYEFFVCNQTKAADYLRDMGSNTEFVTYLTWCHNKSRTDKLQLADIMVKPMQRLTKYSLIIKRIKSYTKSKEAQAHLTEMEKTAANFVFLVNRAIRQKEELQKLEDMEKMIEPYDIDFRDEELDRYFRMLNLIDLKAPMVNCGSENSRALIHQGDLRFKDNMKETEVRVILFTDMLLICKKITKGGSLSYRMIRPKYLLERTVSFARFKNKFNPTEVAGLIYVVRDEHGTACTAFCLSETSKDPNPQETLKIWEHKILEARFSYELSVWYYRNPFRDPEETNTSMAFMEEYPDDWAIEYQSRELVAAMLHRKRREQAVATVYGDSLEPDPPSLINSLRPTSFGSGTGQASFLRYTASGRVPRKPSAHQYASTSALHHEEPALVPRKAGSLIEFLSTPLYTDNADRSTTSKVSERQSESVVPHQQFTAPALTLQKPSPEDSASPRSVSASASGQNTPSTSPRHSVNMGYSLPDLTADHVQKNRLQPLIQQSASEKLYQSHLELLQNSLETSKRHQYLSPGYLDTSYLQARAQPPLKRGLVFSQSFKSLPPPLPLTEHVTTRSEAAASSSSEVELLSTDQPEGSQITQEPLTRTRSDKSTKKKHLTRNKSQTKASNTEPECLKNIDVEDPQHKDGRDGTDNGRDGTDNGRSFIEKSEANKEEQKSHKQN